MPFQVQNWIQVPSRLSLTLSTMRLVGGVSSTTLPLPRSKMGDITDSFCSSATRRECSVLKALRRHVLLGMTLASLELQVGLVDGVDAAALELAEAPRGPGRTQQRAGER